VPFWSRRSRDEQEPPKHRKHKHNTDDSPLEERAWMVIDRWACRGVVLLILTPAKHEREEEQHCVRDEHDHREREPCNRTPNSVTTLSCGH